MYLSEGYSWEAYKKLQPEILFLYWKEIAYGF